MVVSRASFTPSCKTAMKCESEKRRSTSGLFAAARETGIGLYRFLPWLPRILSGYRFGAQLLQSNPPQVGSAPITINPLIDYFENHHTGKGIWKWAHYFSVYHRHFSRFIGQEVHLVEIGIYSGGSLEMWRHYLGDECRVYGVDIEDACRCYENDYTRIFIGDQASPKFWQDFKKSVPRVDILIDDGGHLTFQQIATFESLFPHLSAGGVYVCEDILGGINQFAAYINGFAAQLNAFSQRADGTVDASPVQAQVDAIHCYPFVVVIEKVLCSRCSLEAPMQGDSWQPFFDADRTNS